MNHGTPLRFGIIGCGRIAANHALALAGHPGAEAVACLDADLARADGFAREHGIGHAVSTPEELYGLGLDAVVVCTPHPHHEEAVVRAAGHGVHALCEKPIAVDPAAADRMIAAAGAAGTTLGVVFQRRLWPAARRIRDAVDDGTLGRPLAGEVRVRLHRPAEYYSADPWRGRWDTDGGGVLMTQAVHQIDLLCWYMGTPVAVAGLTATQKHGDHIEVEDTAAAALSFASGAVATVHAHTVGSENLGNLVSVTGESGATASLLEYPEGGEGAIDLWTAPGQRHTADGYADASAATPDLASINAGLRPFHSLQIADFVSALREGRDPAVTGREARDSLAVVDAVYTSCRTGRTVHLDRGGPDPLPRTAEEDREY
ncbi:Gfo/Idh/MocA family oxidoreductase [Nocardiopsis sp. HNM0947]|uniref:Gfo/Idh/MocA family oxidoreductase n=1 Tax=Nocardiopsis coralli TaxID=2772213 RepID=A0ABR9P2Y9_9ACTN|nr:Gfo/Idh/MocA family oxidoreductase [Nocardiopsis coralli]MBE2998189.1 Gfo/Idh/MocA family oxidoreductase [Nocardiopsis coralli]